MSSQIYKKHQNKSNHPIVFILILAYRNSLIPYFNINDHQVTSETKTMAESQSLEQFKGQARLPKFAIPNRYEIFLKPDLNSCKFTGTVQITINIIENTQFLILNAADLTVKNESFWFKSQTHSQVLGLLIFHFVQLGYLFIYSLFWGFVSDTASFGDYFS